MHQTTPNGKQQLQLSTSFAACFAIHSVPLDISCIKSTEDWLDFNMPAATVSTAVANSIAEHTSLCQVEDISSDGTSPCKSTLPSSFFKQEASLQKVRRH